MKSSPLILERIFNAPIARVWQAISNEDQLRQWSFDMTGFRPEVGVEFTFPGENEGRTFIHLCKVLEVIPGRKLSYSWRYRGFEGISYLTLELFDEGGKTRLKLTHEGLETFPQDNPDFARKNFEQGWTELIGVLLKKFVEQPAK